MQKAKRYLILAGIVVLILLLIGIGFAAYFNAWLDILYVSLIVVAAFTLFVAALQIYTIIMLIRTISTVRDELKPLLVSVQETIGVVKDTARSAGQTATAIGTTARFTNDFAIVPTVRTVSLLIAVQQVLRIFLGRGHAGSRADQRRRRQMEAEAAAAVGGE